MSGPSWGVVATIDEPPALAVAFAAWHLDQGAREVHLFLDRDDPETAAALAPLPGVRVTTCDAAWWAAQEDRRRPPGVNKRQTLNAAAAMAVSEADWMLHCDADEFVRDGAALTEALAALPDTARAFRLMVVERVRPGGAVGPDIFAGAFRRPDESFDDWGKAAFGRWAKFLALGLTGHSVGKTLVRRGSGLRPGIHFVRDETDTIIDDGKLDHALLHFDGMTPAHLVIKLLLKRSLCGKPIRGAGSVGGSTAPRAHQARFVQNHAGEPRQLAKWVEGVQGVTDDQQKVLALLGHYFDLPFDIAPALRRFGVAPDLTPAGFDAALAARHAGLLAEYGAVLPEPGR